ncbi:hypothetical protein DPMN_103395 [Dreissena polymorpha]|uniref:Ubiquitin-activating enzyme E1 C-terminal domain-containing protein n=1 Tax=Dreissena polymorpha TaxID=45954 RepID=A0A9D4H8D5_DREPO|nr:hypothetical protein DPMN_103395 [Dreissena polymorpha]
MADENDIDDSLYSRQRYVLGDGAMQRMAKSSVLLYGVGGLGIEIAKNIVLAGVKSVTVQDPLAATLLDLGTQFFLREGDVQGTINRAEACTPRLTELNPYVSIKALKNDLNDSTDLEYLKQFQCVILTEAPLTVQLKVNDFCRNNGIKFISADVYGVFAGAFCDFGDHFDVFDPNGEEPKEVFIEDITKASPGLVTTLEQRLHGFETDDVVTFKEVGGMTALNGKQCNIKVVSPTSFSICDTSGAEFGEFTGGGLAVQVKMGRTVHFESLEEQLKKPDILVSDFSKSQVPGSIHAGFKALHKFRETFGRLPGVWEEEDATKLAAIIAGMKEEGQVEQMGDILTRVTELLSFTCRGCFLPLCATLGGVVAQEAIKAITGKFTPLKQWLFLDAMETVHQKENRLDYQPRGDRYDQLRICVGDGVVGCGAIGCEMLKNYAMMGIATAEPGEITITDNDLIEKSNLNRQFLFRPHHIRKPKSTTAAETVKEINPDVCIVAQQHKVCVQTEKTVYTDAFFEKHDLIVNALDNVEARRYVDSRCVTSRRSLLESGTMATKGHTQVIVAHLTESYTTQRDPPDEQVPYCTLKSFPRNIEHCIQWARDKFESSFAMKPSMFNKFWEAHKDPEAIIQSLLNSEPADGAIGTGKLVKMRPYEWLQCVEIGRLKFQKYFNHRAKNLLHMFPVGHTMADGTLFWQAPKRPPSPIEFSAENELHLQFVVATAQLYAAIYGVTMPSPVDIVEVKKIVAGVKVPPFVPSSKRIEMDETKKSSDAGETISSDELQTAAQIIRTALTQAKDKSKVLLKMVPADFEKDDDTNGHIDFIAAAANLRAEMYHIEGSDRLRIKRIAGKIVPAIATTTAAVSGLISIELVKVVLGLPIDKYRNCFLNLALPMFLLSEPGPATKTVIKEGLSYTSWDIWEVQGNRNFTLQDFMDTLKVKMGNAVNFVGQGTKGVYMGFMPTHNKRLTEKMSKLLKHTEGQKYDDLVVSFESTMDDEDIGGPPIRYFFNL